MRCRRVRRFHKGLRGERDVPQVGPALGAPGQRAARCPARGPRLLPRAPDGRNVRPGKLVPEISGGPPRPRMGRQSRVTENLGQRAAPRPAPPVVVTENAWARFSVTPWSLWRIKRRQFRSHCPVTFRFRSQLRVCFRSHFRSRDVSGHNFGFVSGRISVAQLFRSQLRAPFRAPVGPMH